MRQALAALLLAGSSSWAEEEMNPAAMAKKPATVLRAALDHVDVKKDTASAR